MDMTYFGMFWNSLLLGLTLRFPSNNPAGIKTSTSWNMVGATSYISAYRPKKQVYFTTRNCTTMFLKTVASSKYANIVTTLQSNVDSYRHPNKEYFLPQHFPLSNIATLIHNNAKARVNDLVHCQINRVEGWKSMPDVLEDDELQFCHIQGYQPCVFRITTEGRNQGTSGRGPDHQGFDRWQGYDHQQD
jgi:hypothetical protein